MALFHKFDPRNNWDFQFVTYPHVVERLESCSNSLSKISKFVEGKAKIQKHSAKEHSKNISNSNWNVLSSSSTLFSNEYGTSKRMLESVVEYESVVSDAFIKQQEESEDSLAILLNEKVKFENRIKVCFDDAKKSQRSLRFVESQKLRARQSLDKLRTEQHQLMIKLAQIDGMVGKQNQAVKLKQRLITCKEELITTADEFEVVSDALRKQSISHERTMNDILLRLQDIEFGRMRVVHEQMRAYASAESARLKASLKQLDYVKDKLESFSPRIDAASFVLESSKYISSPRISLLEQVKSENLPIEDVTPTRVFGLSLLPLLFESPLELEDELEDLTMLGSPSEASVSVSVQSGQPQSQAEIIENDLPNTINNPETPTNIDSSVAEENVPIPESIPTQTDSPSQSDETGKLETKNNSDEKEKNVQKRPFISRQDSIDSILSVPSDELHLETLDDLSDELIKIAVYTPQRRVALMKLFNLQRGKEKELKSQCALNGILQVFRGFLDQCLASADTRAAKMAMILTETFFKRKESDKNELGDKVFIQEHLADHLIWKQQEFWDEACMDAIQDELRKWRTEEEKKEALMKQQQQEEEEKEEYEQMQNQLKNHMKAVTLNNEKDSKASKASSSSTVVSSTSSSTSSNSIRKSKSRSSSISGMSTKVKKRNRFAEALSKKERQDNIIFGQLASYAFNMQNFGSNEVMVKNFIHRVGAIYDLSEDLVRVLLSRLGCGLDKVHVIVASPLIEAPNDST